MEGKTLNFNPQTPAEMAQLAEGVLKIGEPYVAERMVDVKRYYDLYYLRLDENIDNPYQINVRLGKAHSHIESGAARTVKNLFGDTPYMPLEPEERYWARNAECMQTILDRESRRFRYFDTFTKATKIMAIAGMCGLESQWRIETKSVTNKVARRRAGITTGYDYEKQIVIEEGLDLRYVPVWALGWDYFQERTGRMRFFYEKYPCSRAEVMRRINAGLYTINGKKVTAADVKEKNAWGKAGNYLKNNLIYGSSWEEMGQCIVLRLWLPDTLRLILLLDGETVIYDEVMDEEVRDDFISIKPLIQCDDPWPDTLMGISALKPVEHLSYLIDDNLARQLRQEEQQFNQVWLYVEDVFPEAENLYAGGGSRIPVSKSWLEENGLSLSDLPNLIQPIKTNPISQDSRYSGEQLERHWNEAANQNQTSRGSETQGDRTKYEIQKMTDATDEVFALKLKIMEVRGLEVLAHDCYKKIGRNISDALARKYLGDKYKYFVRKSPDDIPGGCNVRLKAASLLAGHEQAQNARMADLQMLSKFGFQGPQIAPAIEVYIDNTMHWDEDAKEKIKEILKPAPPEQNGAPPGMPGAAPIAGISPAQAVIQANNVPGPEMAAA